MAELIQMKCRTGICDSAAVVLVWGRLFDAEHLGPRCVDHLPSSVERYYPHALDQIAVLDLRGLQRATPDDAQNEVQLRLHADGSVTWAAPMVPSEGRPTALPLRRTR